MLTGMPVKHRNCFTVKLLPTCNLKYLSDLVNLFESASFSLKKKCYCRMHRVFKSKSTITCRPICNKLFMFKANCKLHVFNFNIHQKMSWLFHCSCDAYKYN